jgi:hypothetical protein
MRLLGFVGIFFLALINVIGMFTAIHGNDWGAIALMSFMAGLLVFFTRTLWRGRRVEREGRLPVAGDDWGNRSISDFFAGPVARLREGKVLIAGSGMSLLLAIVAYVAPAMLGLAAARAGSAITLFALWPVFGFLLYVQLCGPHYRSSLYKVFIMFAIMCLPLYTFYR